MDILDLDVTAADLSDVEEITLDEFDLSDDVEERECVECFDLIPVAELKNGHCEFCAPEENVMATMFAESTRVMVATAVILPVVAPVVTAQKFTPAQMRAALRAAGHAVGTRGLLSEAQKETARALLTA